MNDDDTGHGLASNPATGGAQISALSHLLPLSYFTMIDGIRQAQARMLDAFGVGPRECPFQVIASGPHWRLRDYGGRHAAAPLLIVPAPIKRPYIWDLAPSASVVRHCLEQGLHVYLLEWLEPVRGQAKAGFDEYAGQAIPACIAKISGIHHGEPPFLIGQSLGGTLAAMSCALQPDSVRGLILLGSPLSFAPGSSRFRDALVKMALPTSLEPDIVAGSLLAHLSAAASPETFLWMRTKEWLLSLRNPAALETCLRVERWALDEAALPGRLVKQMVDWLYREDRFTLGSLEICAKRLGPGNLRAPALAVYTVEDEVAPLASIAPFFEAMPTSDTKIIAYTGEIGVGLQHLAILAGPQAFTEIWPQIIAWLKAHEDQTAA